MQYTIKAFCYAWELFEPPVDILYIEANEPRTDLRRLKLTLQCIVKLKANLDNPAFDFVFSSPI